MYVAEFADETSWSMSIRSFNGVFDSVEAFERVLPVWALSRRPIAHNTTLYYGADGVGWYLQEVEVNIPLGRLSGRG